MKMKRYLGTQVHIQLVNKNGTSGLTGQSSGKIEIEFSSMSELDRLYSLIIRKSELTAAP
jgi:hypothetical protein